MPNVNDTLNPNAPGVPVIETLPLAPEQVMAELSYYILPSQIRIYPYNPDDLVIKKGLYIYDQMKDDETVKIALLLKKTVMLAKQFEIEPASQDAIDLKIADFVKYVLFEQLEEPFTRILEEMLSAFDYGYSVSEKLFEYISEGPFAGYMGIRHIRTRPPHGFVFQNDAYGNLAFIRQFQGSSFSKDLPASKFVVHTYGKQFGNPYGISDCRAIYRPWWSKDVVLKFLAIHLERYGTPLVLAKYHGILNATERADLKTLLKNILTGTGFMIPADKAEVEKLEFGEAVGYIEALDRYDKMITRGMLLPDQLGFTNTKSGSYSLGQEQFDFFYLILQKYLNDLDYDVEKQVIKPLVQYNFGKNAKAPKIKATSPKAEDMAKMAEIYGSLTTSGYMSPNNADDLDYIRKKYELPEVKDTNREAAINAAEVTGTGAKSFAMNFSAKPTTQDLALQASMIQNEKLFSKIIAKLLPVISNDDYEKFVTAYQSGDIEGAFKTLEGYDVNGVKDELKNALKERFIEGKRAAK